MAKMTDDIPIKVLPDYEFYRGIAPGTQTEERRSNLAGEKYQQDALTVTRENNEAQALSDALRLEEEKRQADMTNKYQMGSLAEDTRYHDMTNNLGQSELAQKLAASSATQDLNTAKSASAQIRDSFINVLRTGALNYPNYNFKGAFDKANAHGSFNGVSPEDMGKILKEVASLQKGGSGSNDLDALREILNGNN